RRDRVFTTSAARRPWRIAAERPDLLRIPVRPGPDPGAAALPSPSRVPRARSAGWFIGVFTADLGLWACPAQVPAFSLPFPGDDLASVAAASRQPRTVATVLPHRGSTLPSWAAVNGAATWPAIAISLQAFCPAVRCRCRAGAAN